VAVPHTTHILAQPLCSPEDIQGLVYVNRARMHVHVPAAPQADLERSLRARVDAAEPGDGAAARGGDDARGAAGGAEEPAAAPGLPAQAAELPRRVFAPMQARRAGRRCAACTPASQSKHMCPVCTPAWTTRVLQATVCSSDGVAAPS